MRRGKQKVRLSNSVVEIGANNVSVVRKTKRSSAGKRPKKSRLQEEDPLALPSRRTKTVKTKAARKQSAQPVEYEVEKIVGHRQSGGETMYRIRWKGWAAKDDTWQTEDDLSCGAILKKYKSQMPAASPAKGRGRPKSAASTPTKKRKSIGSRGVALGKVTKTGRGRPRMTETSRGRKAVAGSPKKKKKVGRKPKTDKEWEVEEVVAVRTTEKGKEEFYIKWKGYSSDENTWEPSENVANCNRAVERFRMSQGEDGEGVSGLPSDGEEADKPKTNGDAVETAEGEDEDGKEQDKSSSPAAEDE